MKTFYTDTIIFKEQDGFRIDEQEWDADWVSAKDTQTYTKGTIIYAFTEEALSLYSSNQKFALYELLVGEEFPNCETKHIELR